jgi:hypothetical protein
MDPGPIYIILLSPVYFTRTVYFTRILYCFPLDTLIIFVSSKLVRFTTSSQVGNKVLGCVFHAYSYTICLVFCYTSWYFYAFSGTNLLIRCHSASSLFSAVFVFQKSYTENILRIGQNKNRNSYFARMKVKDQTGAGEMLLLCLTPARPRVGK